jgi:hypothetical protein
MGDKKNIASSLNVAMSFNFNDNHYHVTTLTKANDLSGLRG